MDARRERGEAKREDGAEARDAAEARARRETRDETRDTSRGKERRATRARERNERESARECEVARACPNRGDTQEAEGTRPDASRRRGGGEGETDTE